MLPNVLCDYLVVILIREHRQTSYIGDEIGEVVLSKINVQVSRPDVIPATEVKSVGERVRKLTRHLSSIPAGVAPE
jgi:hypothetical protein